MQRKWAEDFGGKGHTPWRVMCMSLNKVTLCCACEHDTHVVEQGSEGENRMPISCQSTTLLSSINKANGSNRKTQIANYSICFLWHPTEVFPTMQLGHGKIRSMMCMQQFWWLSVEMGFDAPLWHLCQFKIAKDSVTPCAIGANCNRFRIVFSTKKKR